MTEIDETRDDTEAEEESAESAPVDATVAESAPADATVAEPAPPPTPVPIAEQPATLAPPPEPTPLDAPPSIEDEPEPASAPVPEPLPVDETKPGTRGSRVVPAPVEPPKSDPSFEIGDLPDPADEAPYRSSNRQGTLRGLVPWALFVLALVAIALVVLQLYMPVVDQLDTTKGKLEAARKDAAILQRQVETLEGLHRELAEKVAKRESEVQALQSTQEELAKRLEKEIEKGQVAISQARGELVVDLIDKVLFDSGEAELNEKGAEVLRQVGETLLKVPDKVIQVTGHTDAMPISDKLEEQFPTNWELSTQRATNVVRFLEEEVQVPGERLAATGRSQYDPIASNKSSKGRRRNRRIEVTLIPLRVIKGK